MVHSFHIPVMGLAFTIDTPIKVAHLGISSVISIGDDFLIEKARDYYSEKYSIPVPTILRKDKDARSLFTTSYLNLVEIIVQNNWESHISKLVNDPEYLEGFLSQLEQAAFWKKEWDAHSERLTKSEMLDWAQAHFPPGSIDVNIMTKLDKKNYSKGKELPIEYNDAHAILRGFAQSNLRSSVVLSAGVNPALFGYFQHFEDFFPDANGEFKKKIILKVSDFRSALIQGKMLAKKGLWVSEFRIESGLNCGGHAFATQGFLMGPILEEFKQRREELFQELFSVWSSALQSQRNFHPAHPELKISAQGGVGTHQEHTFLLQYFQLSSVGWGSPFLLVPEAVSIDPETLQQLAQATEKDLYLSNASPLGVPFNNLKNTSRQNFQKWKAEIGKPGSPCTKKFLQLNTEFGEKPLCTASSQYLQKAFERLEAQNLPQDQLDIEKEKLLEKECLCCGLSMPFLVEHDLDKKMEGKGVSVCPGPNIAYFEGVFTLKDMIQHIYGYKNLISRSDRPNLFIKEIQLYLDYLRDKISALYSQPNEKEKQYFSQYIQNMKSGLDYYKDLFQTKLKTWNSKQNIQNKIHGFLEALKEYQQKLGEMPAPN